MTGDKSKPSTNVHTFTDYLRSTRRRCTPERIMILECAESSPKHFSAEDLCRSLDESGRHVAPGTVYSTLELLVQCGIIVRHRFSDQGMLYELTPATNHHHLVCTRCGRIKDVRDTELVDMLKARRYSAFTPMSFALTVYGICSVCMRRLKSDEKKKLKTTKTTITKAK